MHVNMNLPVEPLLRSDCMVMVYHQARRGGFIRLSAGGLLGASILAGAIACAVPVVDLTGGGGDATSAGDNNRDGGDNGDSGDACQFDADCDPNAICSNEPGGYACTCMAGYLGDGRQCRAASVLFPVLYLPFASSSTWDRSGAGNDAYAYSSAHVEDACAGLESGCIQLTLAPDGQRLEIPYRADLDFDSGQDFTVAFKLRYDRRDVHSALIHGFIGSNRAYPYRISVSDQNLLRVCTYDGSVANCAEQVYAAAPGSWSLVVASRSGNQLCLGLNGAAASCTLVTGGSTRAGEGRIQIGRHPSAGHQLQGALAELIILDYAMSAQELADLVSGVAIVKTCDAGDVGCCGNSVCDAGESVATCVADCADSFWEEKFLREYFKNQAEHTFGLHNYGYAYHIDRRIRPYVDMYEATGKRFYFDRGWDTAIAAVLLLRDEDTDGHKEWPCYDQTYCCTGGIPNIQQGLCAERAARAITGIAKTALQYSDLADLHGVARNNLAAAMRSSLVENPRYANRKIIPVHHIVAHQATVLRNLYEIFGTATYRTGDTGYEVKANAMRGSLFPRISDANAVEWGATYCTSLAHDWPLCYTVIDSYTSQCTDGTPSHTYCSPSDTSHANDYVATVVQFYEASVIYTRADVDRLIYSLKRVMFTDDPVVGPHFSTHIDGLNAPDYDPEKSPPDTTSREHSGFRGNLTPGWTSLARYDAELLGIFARMDRNQSDFRPTQPLGYYAQMCLHGAPAP